MTNTDLDRFLASPATAALGVPADDARTIVERFLDSCATFGVEARFLDGGELHGVVGHVLPARFAIGDPLGAHVGTVLEAFVEFTDAPRKEEQLDALRHTVLECQEAIRTGQAVHHHDHGHEPRLVPFVRDVPKVGRNDPCPCGSGKKFKACHARG
ncbi:MAG: SEC-C domain-containing protein [Planctomycetes bacterium]|nr:SEC-C domain-containing protein [Planctomycetota bacterium]